MTAYLFIKTRIHNEQEYSKYVEAVGPLTATYNSRRIVASRPVEVLEGDESEWGDYLLIVSEWPDVETARRFWHSDDYADIRKLRDGHGTVHVMLTEAL